MAQTHVNELLLAKKEKERADALAKPYATYNHITIFTPLPRVLRLFEEQHGYRLEVVRTLSG